MTNVSRFVDRVMKAHPLRQLVMQEDLNFLLTNRIPRMLFTRWMGRFSQIRNPALTRLSIAVWRLFTDLDLSDARKQRFDSLHDCFTRELVPGSRPIDPDPDVLVSPCDAIVGACGRVENGAVYQAKGFPYTLIDLFGPTQDTSAFQQGWFVTLRLTSAMYHRFHAPHDLTIDHVTALHGDTWNVNPIALKRIERLFCLNERAVIRARLRSDGQPVALVPVAAILVASLRLKFLDLLLHRRAPGATEIPCRATACKGDELGWFQHGSTILVFIGPQWGLAEGLQPGQRIRMGEALMRRKRLDTP